MSKKTKGDHGAFTCASNGMHQPGLTKREYFALHLACAVLSNPEENSRRHQMILLDAVHNADTLIEELNYGI